MNLYKKIQSGIIIFFLLIIFIHSNLLKAENNTEQSLQNPENRDRIVLNVIHSNNIRTIMRRLNMLAYEREYTDLELEQLFKQQIELFINAASELKDSSENLPNITGNKLNETDVTTFRAMANQLYWETLKLQEHINSSHYQETRHSYQRLRETCNACHQLFRDR